MTAAEPCLSPTGLALLPLVYAAKGLCLLRDRRTAPSTPRHRRCSRGLRPLHPERGKPLQLLRAQPARRARTLDSHTPSRTDVPSGNSSDQDRATTTVPSRSAYWASATRPRSNAPARAPPARRGRAFTATASTAVRSHRC
ncbi:hypothetical protein [Streptomyces anulatus]|uniref:hypothetical protein n=1 Tax=Streptomyces anulatus TaxID=1892 RepID=UPI0034066084